MVGEAFKLLNFQGGCVEYQATGGQIQGRGVEPGKMTAKHDQKSRRTRNLPGSQGNKRLYFIYSLPFLK